MIRRNRQERPLEFFDCFTAQFKVCQNRQLLANSHELLEKPSLADLYCCINKDGVGLELDCFVPFEKSYRTSYQNGDSLELFIHTRFDPKSAVHNLFCHHFLFLPDYQQSPFAAEITSFRGGQVRQLAKPSDLYIERRFSEQGYKLEIQIEPNALHGFDPSEYKRLGFFYRLHTSKGKQSFFTNERSNLDYEVRYWPELNLV